MWKSAETSSRFSLEHNRRTMQKHFWTGRPPVWSNKKFQTEAHSDCNTDLISHQTTHGALALRGNPSSNTGGPDFARLRDDYVAEAVFLIVVVQDELRQLGGLAAARGSSNDHHRVVFYEWNQLEGDEHRTQAVRSRLGHLFNITGINMKYKNKFGN